MVETVSESRSQEMLKVFPCKFRYNSFSLDEGDGDDSCDDGGNEGGW